VRDKRDGQLFRSQPDVSYPWGRRLVRWFRPSFAITGQTPEGPAISFRVASGARQTRHGYNYADDRSTSSAALCPCSRDALAHYLVLPGPARHGSGNSHLSPALLLGETGNVNTPALFKIPIPSSRNTVPTGYGYVLPDQNGWSRYLHFEAAWVAVLTGLLYGTFGFFQGHFRRNLLPAPSDLSPKRLAVDIARHLRFRRPSETKPGRTMCYSA